MSQVAQSEMSVYHR